MHQPLPRPLSPLLTRRAALTAAASLPLATSLAAPGFASSAPPTRAPSKARAFKIGDFTVHSLLAGTAARDDVQAIFGGGASDAEFANVAAENFISPDTAQFYFTPTLVDTGAEKILFDTGMNAAGITGALADAGVSPEEIDVVVLTHMHPDHIGGLTDDGAQPTFANARYVTAAQEYNFWSGLETGHRVGDMVAAKVTPMAEKMSFITDQDSVVSGITGVAAGGHTPGHMAYRLESNGAQLILTADLANHYVFSFAHPEWEISFDMDKAAATASRRTVLGMLAADRVPMIGYHMPFPAAGYVESRGEGFRFVPVGYQLMG